MSSEIIFCSHMQRVLISKYEKSEKLLNGELKVLPRIMSCDSVF